MVCVWCSCVMCACVVRVGCVCDVCACLCVMCALCVVHVCDMCMWCVYVCVCTRVLSQICTLVQRTNANSQTGQICLKISALCYIIIIIGGALSSALNREMQFAKVLTRCIYRL